MNNSNKQVVLAGLSALTVGANVGMDEVVSVFISRFEEQQHTDRTSLQKQLVALNGQIKDLTEMVKVDSVQSVSDSIDTKSVAGPFVTMTMTVEPDAGIDWDKGNVAVRVKTRLVAHVVATQYNQTDDGSVNVGIAIGSSSMAVYKELMASKADVTDKLNQVNEKLRNISRTERSVRAKLATMKLEEAGMSDLLASPDLLALVDGSVIEG